MVIRYNAVQLLLCDEICAESGHVQLSHELVAVNVVPLRTKLLLPTYLKNLRNLLMPQVFYVSKMSSRRWIDW